MNVTIVRAMDILDLFIFHSKLNLQEIIQLSGRPKTSILRILQSFETIGFLERDSNGDYSLGLKLLQLGHLVSERLDINQLAMPIMEELYQKTGKTIMLSLLQGDKVITVASLETEHPIKIGSSIGRQTPLYAGSPARIILAFQPEKKQKTYLDSISLQKIASNTITDKDQLSEVLNKNIKDKYVLSHSEVNDHTTGLSAPIFNHKNEVFAAITIAGISADFTELEIPELIKEVQAAALAISSQFGYQGTF
ncbi:IclR family transcriptional regulator [Bacillus norwichensis]|uniref:IclR family transcriptional regulator n=1 Tax=Bacillus norwichensis TaxID=2762217 RepID=A0ABR8VN68_9BACI|nr:IclR family transcriptional regulator [Bacillus norwichensis]MBD8006192.1 IclR family transcriptional regulator [Bacillus norwichensis]